jgi:hypothetical protein
LKTAASATCYICAYLYYRSLCCSWTCLHCKGMCCTWTSLHHRGLSSTRNVSCATGSYATSGRI